MKVRISEDFRVAYKRLKKRHITADDRIIYDIYDERVTVLIIQAEEHYNDK